MYYQVHSTHENWRRQTGSKTQSELLVTEKALLQANNRALDILSSVVDKNEHGEIANCNIAKEA